MSTATSRITSVRWWRRHHEVSPRGAEEEFRRGAKAYAKEEGWVHLFGRHCQAVAAPGSRTRAGRCRERPGSPRCARGCPRRVARPAGSRRATPCAQTTKWPPKRLAATAVGHAPRTVPWRGSPTWHCPPLFQRAQPPSISEAKPGQCSERILCRQSLFF